MANDDAGLQPPTETPLWVRFIHHRVALIASFDVLFIIIVGSLRPGFVGWPNIVALCDSMSLPAIVLVPATMLLAAGRFDLSPDGVSAASGVVAGEMMTHLAHTVLVSSLAVVAGLLVGVVFGLTNGWLIERVGINPLIATLGTWWIAAGIALGVEQGGNSFGLGPKFDAFGGTRIGGLLIEDWVAIPVLVIGGIVLAYRRSGAHMFATGGNREAARRNGIHIHGIVIWLYVFSGVAAAFAGVVFASRLDSSTTNPFNGLALQVIASAVIGGSSLLGGKGTVTGAFLGLLLASDDHQCHGIPGRIAILGAGHYRDDPARRRLRRHTISARRTSSELGTRARLPFPVHDGTPARVFKVATATVTACRLVWTYWGSREG